MPETFYCELQDVIGVGVSMEKLIQLTDDNKTGQYNQEIFDTCRRAADSQINGFAMVKYSEKIPFNPVPTAIRTIATILTKYYLYFRRSAIDEKLQEAYDNQVSLLKMLSAGTFKLEQESTPVTEDTVLFTDKKPEDRYFHIDNMSGYLP